MRAEWIKILCGIIVLMLSISGFGMISGNKTLEQFKSGSTFDVTFPVGGGSNNQSILQLPIDANVQSATMVIEGEAVAGTYPSHIELDVGEDGVIEWKFDEIGSGSWGWQNTFWNGVNNTPMNMGQILNNHTVGVRLPAGVTIDSATVDFWAEEQDYMDSVIELNLPGGGLPGPWDDVHDYDPIIVVFQNKLLDIYRTHSDKISNGTDGDLVVNWTINGIDWVDHNEVTKVSDGTWPWDNSRAHWWGMDMRPTSAIYNNRLYLAWESNSTKVGPHWPGITNDPDDNRGITSGYDKDIVITSSSDGITWSDQPADFIEITPPAVENGNTSGQYGYNTAQTMPQDWLPQIATFNPGSGDRLYCLWVTNNTDTPKEWYGGSDLMVTWSDDPDSASGWSDVNRTVNLTPGDAWNGSDFNPKLIVFDDKLFAIWQTNDTSRGNGSDYDILLRYTEDGDTWSSTTYQVSPKGMNDWTEEYYNNEYKQEFWDMTPSPIVFNNKLGIVWETENFQYTYNRTWNKTVNDQTDADIVVAWSSDGISWDLDFGTNIFEITQAQNDWGDHYPSMITLDPDGTGPQDERLYAGWNSNDKGISIWDYDIMYTYSTDGENWKPQRVGSTNPDFGGGDYLVRMAEYKGWLYLTYWSFDDKDGPKQGMYADGDDADVLVRRIVPSYLPVPNVSLNVNNDGTNEFGPGMLSQSVQTLDIKSSLQATINSASTFHTDIFKNDYVDIVFNVSSPDVPCRLWLANLDIKYSTSGGKFSANVADFSAALNEYIRVHQTDADAADGVLDIPLKLSSDSAGKLTMKSINVVYNQKPTIQITSPGDILAFAKTNYTITWSASDPDDTDSTITLYMDSDNKVGGEVEIDTSASPITVSSNNFFNWDTSAIEIGKEYYIKAVIDDGDDTAYDYSNSKVRVTRDNVPPAISLLTPTATNALTEFDFWISWVDSDEDSNAWISLYYDEDTDPSSGKTLIVDQLREDHSTDKYHWIIGDDVGVGKYYIYAEISDDENTTYDYSDGYVELITPSLQKPVNLNIKNNLDTAPTLRTHDLLPELFWENSPFNPLPNATNLIDYSYIVNAGTSQSTPDDLLKNWETSDRKVVLANDLSFGEAYFLQVVVTDGRGHYSSAAEATFEIVNNAPSSPEIRITPGDPNTESTLTVEIVNESVDPDNDLVKYEYSWFKGQSEETDYAGKVSISPEDTKKGDVWKVFVTPYDLVNGLKQATGDSATKSIVIGNAAPRPEITVPENNTEYEHGSTITFVGNANDPDFADTESEALSYTWSSDVQGTLNTDGPTFDISSLPVGRHTITLEVENEGLKASDSIWVKIIKKSEPPTGPGEEEGFSTAALAGIGIIIVVVLLIVVLMFLMRKRTKEEPLYPELDAAPTEMIDEGPSAEQLYGEDMPGTEGATPAIAPPGGETAPEQLPPGPDEGAEAGEEGEAGEEEAPEEEAPEPSEPQPVSGGSLPDMEMPETEE
jgi:hypothetical protein